MRCRSRDRSPAPPRCWACPTATCGASCAAGRPASRIPCWCGRRAARPAGALRREAAVGRAPGAGAAGAPDRVPAGRTRTRLRGGLRRCRAGADAVRQPRRRPLAAARLRRAAGAAAPGRALLRQRGCHCGAERRTLHAGGLPQLAAAGAGQPHAAHLPAAAAAGPAQAHRLRRAQPGADAGAWQSLRLQSMADVVAGARFVNARRRSGTRLLCDELLERDGIAPATSAATNARNLRTRRWRRPSPQRGRGAGHRGARRAPAGWSSRPCCRNATTSCASRKRSTRSPSRRCGACCRGELAAAAGGAARLCAVEERRSAEPRRSCRGGSCRRRRKSA